VALRGVGRPITILRLVRAAEWVHCHVVAQLLPVAVVTSDRPAIMPDSPRRDQGSRSLGPELGPSRAAARKASFNLTRQFPHRRCFARIPLRKPR
jgi:hypothetical protein